VEHEAPNRIHAAMTAMSLNFISSFLGGPTLSVNRICWLKLHEFGPDPQQRDCHEKEDRYGGFVGDHLNFAS